MTLQSYIPLPSSVLYLVAGLSFNDLKFLNQSVFRWNRGIAVILDIKFFDMSSIFQLFFYNNFHQYSKHANVYMCTLEKNTENSI